MTEASQPALDRVTIVVTAIALLTLTGGYLLLSAPESLVLVDGALEWQAQSPLRAVVQLLCLDYQFPTINAGDVKGYCLGLGVALSSVALGLAALSRPHRDSANSSPNDRPAEKRSLLVAAQFLAVLFILWSFASARWSHAPDIAASGSTLLAIQILWALLLGNTIRASAVRYVVRGFLNIALAAAGIAVWYYYGRNPTLRAKFPFGNPTFLAAALIPGITLALAFLCHLADQIFERTQPVSGKLIFWTIVAALLAGIGIWACILSDSRGAQVGLAAAVLAMWFFALRGWLRVIPVTVALILPLAAWLYFAGDSKALLAGRLDTLRLRGYAWSYALDLVRDRPVTGHGQGGYTLLADSRVSGDIIENPLVFDGRLDHAHNEWLEVLADLGAVGFLLVLAVLVLTMVGCNSVPRRTTPEHRWCMIGLAAALAGLCVEECAGVGLRVSEVPLVFYTILGLAWAGQSDRSPLLDWCARSRAKGVTLGLACLLAAAGAWVATQLDFQSARATFEIERLVSDGRLDEAVESAEKGLWRLSPQRSLAGRYKAAETYVRWAERMIARATDRHQRGKATEPPDVRLLELARQDVELAEQAIRAGGHALKELIERSPAYINSGYLDCRTHLVRAQSALLRGDVQELDVSRKSAVAGLERELLRQPFREDLSIMFARFAAADVSPARVLSVLARPLRYQPITNQTVQILEEASQKPGIREELIGLSTAAQALQRPDLETDWAPELLRMSAALEFVSGEYAIAATRLEVASRLYASLPRPATLGEAACHLERAEALFFADPSASGAPIEEANQAISLAPQSRLGRELQSQVRDRLIHYALAIDDENLALDLLRKAAPRNTSEEGLRREMGVQLRRLSESVLLHRREAMILRKPAESLLPTLMRWILRAIELNPDDYAARLIAADISLHSGLPEEAAEHLRAALRLGMNPSEVTRFLGMALEREPESPALKSLADELQSADLASHRKGP